MEWQILYGKNYMLIKILVEVLIKMHISLFFKILNFLIYVESKIFLFLIGSVWA